MIDFNLWVWFCPIASQGPRHNQSSTDQCFFMLSLFTVRVVFSFMRLSFPLLCYVLRCSLRLVLWDVLCVAIVLFFADLFAAPVFGLLFFSGQDVPPRISEGDNWARNEGDHRSRNPWANIGRAIPMFHKSCNRAIRCNLQTLTC